jgi:hypothetical protein
MSFTRKNIRINQKLIKSYKWNCPKKRIGHTNQIKEVFLEKSIYYEELAKPIKASGISSQRGQKRK